jgi:uncharacterized membrane protein
MSQKNHNKTHGIASLFEREELRTSFVNYIYIVIGLELIIFVVMLVASVGIAKEPFPWKTFLIAAFTIPVIITFLAGIIILSFNSFFFESHSAADAKAQEHPSENDNAYLLKANSLFDNLHKVPIMLTLFFVIMAALAIYKLDDAFMVIFTTGERLFKYILIAVGVVLLIVTLIAFTWLIMNFKLRKKHMECQVKYRQAAMEHLGLLLPEDKTDIDPDCVIAAPFHLRGQKKMENRKGLIILPPRTGNTEGN